jgi:UDP:flavonoid glycosyltransferase YjiC (YdhE family)
LPAGRRPSPEWLAQLPDRATIYVTLGTAASFAGHGRALLDGVADGLGDLDMNIIISGTAGEQGGRLPANVYAAGFGPLAEVLSRSHLVISHAGAGTTLAALRAGVPQLLLPMGADQFRNTDAVAKAGAGRQLELEELEGAAMRRRVEDMLGDSGVAVAARGIADEINSMPGPDAAVSALQGLGSTSMEET